MLRSVDGPIAPLPCLSRTAYRRCDDCRDEASCELRIAFDKAYRDYLSTLEHLSLADVMRQADESPRHALLEEGAAPPNPKFLLLNNFNRLIDSFKSGQFSA